MSAPIRIAGARDHAGVCALLGDELRSNRKRDVRDRVVNHVPERGRAGRRASTREQDPTLAARQPLWLWTGGALSVLIILAITVASPRIGLAATIGIIIAFNLGVAALIDRFGWFGFDQITITWTRALGLVLLGAGAALSLFKSG